MNGSSIQLFEHETYGQLRTITIDGEPWFVAKDVCDALSIATNHLNESGRGLDEDEIMNLPNWENGGRAPLIVSEAGLYSLIMRSRKPEAKAFKRWVTHDVLTSIRKHGMYATPQTVEQMLADPDTMIATLKALKAERQKVVALTEDNARMLPKSVAYDAMIDTDGTTTITQVSRYLNQMGTPMTARKLYGLLRADELVCKRDNAPTKKAISKGLAKQVMTVRSDGKQNAPYARLTQKGVDWCVTHYANIPAQMKAM